MKIRTLTTGIRLESPTDTHTIEKAAQFNRQAQQFFEQKGYAVQTTRIATNSWVEYLLDSSASELLTQLQNLEEICQSLKLDFFNIGCTDNPDLIPLIPRINKNTSLIYCSTKIGDAKTGINLASLRESAKAIKEISEETENGFGNFRFCATANCPPGIPFFPAAYHEGEPAFSIGLESGDLVTEAFANAKDLLDAETQLKAIYEDRLTAVEAIAVEIAEKFNLKYGGIDSSLAPSLDKKESIAYAYESLKLGKFGESGTLAISTIITRVLKSLSVNLCGYSGLMLPVCEDAGLAERANEQRYNLTNLLLYSAVCGCGLDTVPLPGKISVDQLEGILLDMASLAIKLDKPLSARLFPIPGKKAGEMTAFDSPYLVDCKIFAVD